MRKSGIEVVGDIPWGSHLCLFYEARSDLLGVAASYLKAGLEGNELCVWVVSPDISQKDALAALAPAVPALETHLRTHRLQVVPHSQVYFTGKTLDPEHVLHWWQNRLDEVSQRGFEGLRVLGDTAWLERKDRDTFAGCEEAASEGMVGKQVLALCAYPLDKCNPSDVFDVVQTHGSQVGAGFCYLLGGGVQSGLACAESPACDAFTRSDCYRCRFVGFLAGDQPSSGYKVAFLLVVQTYDGLLR